MSQYPKILYVEDDPMSRMVMEILLRDNMNLTNVVIFADSVDFSERLNSFPWIPDVILLDIHMKPLTGFDMLEILRQHPAFSQIPVIALTASVMNEEVDMLRSAGFDGLLAKPLREEEFPHILQRILQGETVWTI